MKRSPLKRRKKPLRLGSYPLQRLAGALIQQEFERRAVAKKKPLGASLVGFPRSWYPKGTKPRKPLRKKGLRSARSASALQAFREAVLARSGGKCERCGYDPLAPFQTLVRQVVAHHRLPRARGGKHVLENGSALCSGLLMGCHEAVHDHRALDWRSWITQTKPSAQRFKP